MKTLLALILLAACKKEVVPPIVVTQPQKEVVKTVADYSEEIYPQKGWDVRYDQVIDLLVKDYPLVLPCETKLFLKAMTYAESSHNNQSYYMEPPPLSRYSIGLFQLSLSDAKYYPCLFKTEKEIENPILNIDCAIKIMHRLQTKYPAQSAWEQLGRYWSICRWEKYTMWKGKSQSGFLRFKKYLASSGCVIE